jgi:hypothetical protein
MVNRDQRCIFLLDWAIESHDVFDMTSVREEIKGLHGGECKSGIA